MSVLGDLPEGVSAAMFLRDGWPDAVVCKVLMTTGCIGIGIIRIPRGYPRLTPAAADELALKDAMGHLSASPPDYTEIHEHAAAMKAKADAAAPAEPDHDLQASLGQGAHP
jgi:hypothetical protein